MSSFNEGIFRVEFGDGFFFFFFIWPRIGFNSVSGYHFLAAYADQN